jgi:hypothetical protein
MANLPRDFEGDAFISYAHLDNAALVEGHKGWVANLHRALEVRVGQLLGKSPHIWRDPKLHGNDLFADALIEKLGQVAVLVSIVTPRYVTSEWTMRELREFWSAAEAQGGVRVHDKARIFKVLKTPVPLERTPAELRLLLGYEFFKEDPETGKIRELDEVFGPEAQRDFWCKLDDLAHDIVALLEAIHAGEPPPDTTATPRGDTDGGPGATAAAAAPRPATSSASSKGAIYLAETTGDLREQREQLRRDLQRHGYTVLPAESLPHEAGEAEAAIRAHLAACRMSIHMVGRIYSLVPEGGSASLIELQHELASERARDDRFLRLLWVPDGQTITDERQAKVVERLRLDPSIRDRADFLETMFEDLRTAVQDWLIEGPRAQPSPEAAPSGAAAPLLYLVADQRDAQFILPWQDALFDQGLEVIRPLFDGDESEIRQFHEENLTLCDGVLIFYGSANELWLQRKLRELLKAPGYGRTKPRPLVGVCMVGARTGEKERFRSHGVLVLPQWEGVSLPALQPFLTRLKAGPSV